MPCFAIPVSHIFQKVRVHGRDNVALVKAVGRQCMLFFLPSSRMGVCVARTVWGW